MSDIREPLDAERSRALEPDAYHTRREFLQRTAVSAGLTAAMGLVLDPDTLLAEASRRQRAVRIPSPRNLPIDTFVVLMMENRSFDHYLGWLPGADGRQAGLRFTDTQGQTHATHRLRSDFQGCAYLDPDHSWQGGRTELDGGRMDGFLRAQSDVFSIGYYTEDDLPFTPHVAKAFTAFDRFFCSLLSSTYPNREYMHAGQSYGKIDNSLPSGSGFPDTTIFNALSQAGVSNRYYYSDIPVSALWGQAGLARSSPVQTYYEQAATGTLPALSFVDPAFNGEDQGTSGDEHPHGDVRVGQAFAADVVHAFLESPQYKRGALFIVYDEWGGFFDHVVPPRVPDLRSSSEVNEDFGQMGFRIPAVAVSPYARSGHVDHSIYGFESILKMIRYRYGLPPLSRAICMRTTSPPRSTLSPGRNTSRHRRHQLPARTASRPWRSRSRPPRSLAFTLPWRSRSMSPRTPASSTSPPAHCGSASSSPASAAARSERLQAPCCSTSSSVRSRRPDGLTTRPRAGGASQRCMAC